MNVMKCTREEWKKLSDRVMYSLRPTQYPVAMKFAHTQEELDAIPNMNYCQNIFRRLSVLQETISQDRTVRSTTVVWM